MKTIEEEAKEFSNTRGSQSCKSMREIEYDTGRFVGFKSGIEFAQRWISVKEELPELIELTYSDNILFKRKDGLISLGMFHISAIYGKYFITDSGEQVSDTYITHWRPIELK